MPLHIFSLTEVKKRCTPECTWVVYDRKVYNITEYIRSGLHPGGNGVFQDYLGLDLTEAFRDIGHSASAAKLLETFCIGILDDDEDCCSTSNSTDAAVSATSASSVLSSPFSSHSVIFPNMFPSVPVPPTNDTAVIDSSTSSSFFQLSSSSPASPNEQPFIAHSVNFRKPLVHQIYNLNKEQYNALSLEFFCFNYICEFFHNPFLEMLSRTVWWIIPTLWLPIAFVTYLLSYQYYGLSKLTSGVCFILGIILWTLIEYLMHRFLFHFPEELLPDNHLVRVIHFMGHGIHHLVPMDAMRLVMPPVLLIVISVPFYTLARLILPNWFVHAGLPGVIVGYVVYDMVHYASHHFVVEQLPGLGYMKRYHMKHHFKEPGKAYGVSTPIWDFVFGTNL